VFKQNMLNVLASTVPEGPISGSHSDDIRNGKYFIVF